ncbi:enoyl-CoA hydratase [Pseudomonas taiwanensis]|uniref:enoyl-CoA hydratase/isomerase family protein n=1 Tax=Pseudomonas TaxID=286 RepID=UPI0015BC7B80|nr:MULTISPECIES: enoyl-CoA hydratase-related protein [Pseudomonas]MDH4560761.1 enoyl-CoA hydratase/isomerase family protein [Pseudomonas sp. BN411]MDH4653713.1 enoyl-CoA hydratase/isomerase family protein [Pseudomonas sp. BN606]MDH4874110.1 enoyl-CoA hydratase/isomerase family protein [Pseudomonas sp. BN515]NWL75742.1 enoyl-CoA hydratase [Pseudomonas taiwanensis]
MSPTNIQSGNESAILEMVGPIAVITLNRPGSFNAIDIEMAVCLEQLALTVERSDSVRVLVIRGAGKAFCAGGDVNLFLSHLDDLAPPIGKLLEHFNRFLSVLRRMDKLVLTSVHGAVAGAGFSMAFMGDFCIAAANTRFRPAYAQIGVSPDGGGTIGVVQALGARRALQIFLDETELSADEASQLGLLSRVVEPAELEGKTHEYAERLAELSPIAASRTKRLVWQSASVPLEQQLEAEAQSIIACMATSEFRELLKGLRRR